jgi:hypothetical protein
MEIAKEGKSTDGLSLIPVLYYVTEKKLYVAGCNVKGCPCNIGGIHCSSLISLDTFKFVAHEYDGDNCVKLPCG